MDCSRLHSQSQSFVNLKQPKQLFVIFFTCKISSIFDVLNMLYNLQILFGKTCEHNKVNISMRGSRKVPVIL